MIDHLLTYVTIGFAIIAYVARPEKPYFELVVKPNENFANIIRIKLNEQITNRISSLFVKLSFFRQATNNLLVDKFNDKLNNDKKDFVKYNSTTTNAQKMSNFYRNLYGKGINCKPIEYISEDGSYGQFVYFD